MASEPALKLVASNGEVKKAAPKKKAVAKKKPVAKKAAPKKKAVAKKKPADHPKNVAEAAAAGTQLELLEALSARIAKTVADPNCPPRDLAALSRRLQELSKEIYAIKERQAKEAEEHDEARDETFDPTTI